MSYNITIVLGFFTNRNRGTISPCSLKRGRNRLTHQSRRQSLVNHGHGHDFKSAFDIIRDISKVFFVVLWNQNGFQPAALRRKQLFL